MRFVFLDPAGTAGLWLYVVVQAETGVSYQQQYGGIACRQGQVEGYLVPLSAPAALDALMKWSTVALRTTVASTGRTRSRTRSFLTRAGRPRPMRPGCR